ncbi:hypothetical protein BJV74DRAFT_811952 [Russula compacta]|nr:hypothetical protein BJV74DRAFT_811952 [Russula compacta]
MHTSAQKPDRVHKAAAPPTPSQHRHTWELQPPPARPHPHPHVCAAGPRLRLTDAHPGPKPERVHEVAPAPAAPAPPSPLSPKPEHVREERMYRPGVFSLWNGRPRARPVSSSRHTHSLRCPHCRSAVYGTYLAPRSHTHTFPLENIYHTLLIGGESIIVATALATAPALTPMQHCSCHRHCRHGEASWGTE